MFALLEDRLAGSARLYTDVAGVHISHGPQDLAAVWRAVETDQRRGWHAVVLADFEWGVLLQGLTSRHPMSGRAPALRVLMFRTLQRLDEKGVEHWLQVQDAGHAHPTAAAVLGLQPDLDRTAFGDALAHIHEAIRCGETYQVNFTDRWHGELVGSPAALYRRLRACQPVAYAAWVVVPGEPGPDGVGVGPGEHVLSMSPELFLQHRQGRVTARPMKGTAARGGTPEEDAQLAQGLRRDPKNRAENLMIVDLLRNDLGRLAEVGGVQVPALFDIESYATVHQMTSTVTAQLRPDIDMAALWRATFPCGSITGAPKRQTLAWIDRLEHSARGLYCGALGWVDAPPADGPPGRPGDFCLSVAIRTLVLRPRPDAPHTWPLTLGVGAGIVLDSRADDEWRECQIKARFLTAIDPGFELFETLRVEHASSSPHWVARERHLDRMAASAAALGFDFDRQAAVNRLEAVAWPEGVSVNPPAVWRVRLGLQRDGRMTLAVAPLPPLPPGPVRVFLHDQSRPDHQPLAAHKTSWRAHYDAAVREAEARGGFDMLFFTASGRLTEGGRSNVLLRLGDAWYTPPVTDGVLPGVARAQVLASGLDGRPVHERTLGLQDLRAADELRVGNALRGWLPARLVWP